MKNLPKINKTKALDVRARIQVGAILSRLAQHVDGTLDLSPTQISAAKLLLDKSLPSLAHTTVSGEGGAPISVVLSREDMDAL